MEYSLDSLLGLFPETPSFIKEVSLPMPHAAAAAVRELRAAVPSLWKYSTRPHSTARVDLLDTPGCQAGRLLLWSDPARVEKSGR